MVSTVSLTMPQVIDNDDNGTPEDILILVTIGDEHHQDKNVQVKIDKGVGRNITCVVAL